MSVGDCAPTCSAAQRPQSGVTAKRYKLVGLRLYFLVIQKSFWLEGAVTAVPTVGGTLIVPESESLVVRADGYNNLVWRAIVPYIVFPDANHPRL